MSQLTGKDTLIICHNSQGAEVRATLLRLSRYTVVFEVYNPYSILQLSEVLTQFKVIMNDRLVYSGRAVVSNLLNTGILLVCECTLEDEWLDPEIFTSIRGKNKLQGEFGDFLREWEKIHHVADDLKVVVADMQTFLMETRRWLEQVELGIRAEPSSDRAQAEKEAVLELKDVISPPAASLFERFELTAGRVPEELQSVHRAYSKKQIHPLVLCSPFIYRVFHKPLGYAGDYEMVNMMLREPFEGGSLFAKILNTYFVGAPPCQAHRNRIKHLVRKLTQETDRVARLGRKARIMDMACGPAKEVQEFIAQEPLCEQAEFTLMDFNDETLEFTKKTLESLKAQNHRSTKVRMVKKSVNHILKDSFKASGTVKEEEYDFIYCAGLFDYLEDRICKKLMDYFYEFLAPGGLLLTTNVTPSNPFRNVMESLMEWHLIYRNEAQMRLLKPETAPDAAFEVKMEDTGINVFLEVRKPK